LYIFLLFYLTTSFLNANIFVVTDNKGNVIEHKKLKPTHNAALNQDATEYSFQAMYDLLHKEENLARMAQAQKEAAKKRETTTPSLPNQPQTDHQEFIRYAKYFKGGKYVWGGTSPEGFDCSGYVQYLYHKVHIDLPRTAWAQYQKGTPVEKSDLKKGDLLFFLTDKSRGIPVTHVGIYLGNGEFIHAASSKQGIIISPLNHGHYAHIFVGAKRVLPTTN
jgi:cell wall-associated NlpC family hydrolase